MGDWQRLLEVTASIQSQGMALSEWADSQPEPWATVLRFLPITGAFILGLLLVLLWKRKSPEIQSVEPVEEPHEPAVQVESDAEKKLPLLQSELKITLDKNKRQKERISSAKRALEAKDEELGKKDQELISRNQDLTKLRLELIAATDAAASVEESASEIPSPLIESEPREDLQNFAAASEELAQAATQYREKISSEESFGQAESETPVEWDELLLFRSSDPSIWNGSVSDDDNHCAILLSEIPANVAWLRIRRLDTDEGIIIPVQSREITQDGGDRSFGFNGSNEEFYGARHLGIYGEELPQAVETRFAYGGWGFGHRVNGETAQACAWAGQEIDGDTVMEITVFPRLPELTANDQMIESS